MLSIAFIFNTHDTSKVLPYRRQMTEIFQKTDDLIIAAKIASGRKAAFNVLSVRGG
ncbi:hypothetical protein ACFSJQ_03725 [Vibrio olivae]